MMQKQIILSLCIGALLGAAVVAVYQFASEQSFGRMHDSEGGVMRDAQMMNGTGHGMQMQQMFVTSERAFIEHMIPHHREAIDTAREVLERGGTTEEIRELMNNIVTAQSAEIESMRTWYQEWYGEVYEDTGEYEPMMRELEGLSGTELDRIFLEDMIMHQMGAIMMARSVQPYIEHDAVAELTQSIVTTQSAEIEQMRRMLEDF